MANLNKQMRKKCCIQILHEMIRIKMARVILAFLLITDKDCSGKKNYACGLVAKLWPSPPEFL